MQRHLYPDNWDEIANSIKKNANWACQECGKPCRPPHIPFRETRSWLEAQHEDWLPHLYDNIDDDEHGSTEIEKAYRFTLTVAHLDHNPANCKRSNLKAMCAPCHLAYDAPHHAASRQQNRMKKREEAGQLTLPLSSKESNTPDDAINANGNVISDFIDTLVNDDTLSYEEKLKHLNDAIDNQPRQKHQSPHTGHILTRKELLNRISAKKLNGLKHLAKVQDNKGQWWQCVRKQKKTDKLLSTFQYNGVKILFIGIDDKDDSYTNYI